MGENLTRKLIRSHLVSGEMIPGEQIALHIDQTLLQDATGTIAWLEFEALGINFFDTADIYTGGEAERILGSALGSADAAAKRHLG